MWTLAKNRDGWMTEPSRFGVMAQL